MIPQENSQQRTQLYVLRAEENISEQKQTLQARVNTRKTKARLRQM